MHYAHFDAPHIPNRETLLRVQKYILIVAAVLALAALIEHHVGLISAVAVIAVLALALVERVMTLPANSAAPSQASTKYRCGDGGSSRAGAFEKKSRVAAKAGFVSDGGSQK
jgi:hypothetical protein